MRDSMRGTVAPRHAAYPWRAVMRGAALAVFCLAAGGAGAEITGARYAEPTSVYGHGVVPGGEYTGIEVTIDGTRVIGNAPKDGVYEDTTPRLVDMNGDGNPEVLSVVSYFNAGAAIRVWGERPQPDHPEGSALVLLAENAPIGRPYRWLAIAGAADLDGDGAVEIAYIDRPHLAKTLRILRYSEDDGQGHLEEIATLAGLTNHRIGEDFITGGVRTCGAAPEIITVDANWQRIVATVLTDGALVSREIAPFQGRASVEAAMVCEVG